MKKLIVLIVVLCPFAGISQDFAKATSIADSLYKAKQYKESGMYYDLAFGIQDGSSADYYNAACNWALAKDESKAITCLKKAIEKGYIDIEWIQQDSDLEALRKHKDWPRLLEQVQSNIEELKKNGLSKEQRESVLLSAAEAIKKHHYSEQGGKTVADNLLAEYKRGRFDTATTTKSFFHSITTYLRAVTNDWHFYLGLDNSFWKRTVTSTAATVPLTDKEKNYGFEEVKILPGNVGYLKWNSCIASDEALAKAAAIMTFLADAKAIIVDVSDNGGGNGKMGRFLSAYFLGYDKPLTSGECRNKADSKVETTVSYVPGKLLLKVPLYVLISGNTGSAAEYFAHYLKEEKRATIVGQKSIGGAHPAIGLSLPYKTMLQVPVCVLWSYSTHKDFEGVGVIPDIEIKTGDKISEVLKIINKK
jgi:hypothetical protein